MQYLHQSGHSLHTPRLRVESISKHQTTRIQSEHQDFSVFNDLNERGFDLYGVSENHFAGSEYGFDKPFNKFRDSLFNRTKPFLNGKDATQMLPKSDSSTLVRGIRGLLNSVYSKDPKSIFNFLYFTLQYLIDSDGLLSHWHPIFEPRYAHNPRRSTKLVNKFISDEMTTNGDAFLFVNYRITHTPYYPPARIQKESDNGPLSFREVRDLNDNYAHPIEFMQSEYRQQELDKKLTKLRSLYTGAVKHCDTEIKSIINCLNNTGLEEDTYVIITSDHGELLGERCVFDNARRVGHVDSVHDNLLNVPLIIGNPNISGTTVYERVELKDILPCVNNCIGTEDIKKKAFRKDGMVAVESPATGDPSAFDGKDDIPDDVINRTSYEDIVVTYKNNWKFIISSAGDCYGFKNSEQVNKCDIPSDMIKVGEKHLKRLQKINSSQDEQKLSRNAADTLRDLGYI